MMIRLTLLFTLLCTQFSFAQWRAIAPVGTTINDITFTDQYNGYAVFQSSGIGNCTVSHGLMKTIDAGQNWVRMNTGNTSAINAVHFVNQLTGWYTATSSEIRKTTDGGVTWVQQNYGVGSGNNDIWFNDVNNGFVIGDNGILRKTTNGGSTWQTIASGVTVTLRRIFFATPTIGFITCSNGQLLKTTNGGTSWSASTTGAGGINDIYFTSATTGYICFSNSMYKTTNGGSSWSPLTTNAVNPILRIFFPTATTGYCTVDGEGILKTTDAGATWNLTPTANGIYDTYRAIYFTDENNGYVGGNLGRITKTSNGGITWNNMTSGLGTELFTVYATHKDTAYTGGREGKIFKTSNGGTTYFQQAKLVNGLSIVNKLYFLNGQTGFAALDSGRIFKTTNGGATWQLKPTTTLQGISDMHFINFNEGFASTSLGGAVLKTTDNGETWDSIATGINEGFRGIWFINADTGFVISNTKIISTYNAGLTWNNFTPPNSSSLNDIVFVNDSLGYCVGSFGKILFTTNAGLNWYPTNTNSNNAEINEMWFANASNGYFAKQTSQSITVDSCKNVGSASTACLANNWTMNSISMTDGGTYGYCVGGLNGTIHQTEVPEIIRAYTSTDAYCAGSSIFIGYHAKGFYGTGNVFTAELSDASGSFASPTAIGTYTATPTTYKSGIITATIPISANGGNYRVRVIASNPAVESPNNGFPITITPSPQPSVSLQSNTQGAVCAGSTIVLSTSNFAGGLDPLYTWTINGQTIANTASNYSTSTLQNGDLVQVSMSSNLACASALPVLSNTFTAIISTGLPLSLANDTVVCQNSTIQLSAPVGYTYNWFPSTGLNNAHIANPTASINNDIQYTLTITDASGCAGVDSIFIASSASPQFSLGADTAVCQNTNIQLNAPIGFSYSWIPTTGLSNATSANPTANISNTITYTVAVSNVNGCSSSDTITIAANAVPSISLSNDTAICEGVCVAINANITGVFNQINWTAAPTLSDSTIINPLACPTATTSYTATISTLEQCSATATITINVDNLPAIPQIIFDGVTLMTDLASSYQWLLNSDTIIGANNVSLVPIANGDYSVIVTNNAGCSTISNPFAVIISAIENIDLMNTITIYPIPAKDIVNIEVKQNNAQPVLLTIYDAQGKQVWQQWQAVSGKVSVATTHLASGLYFLKAISGDKVAIHKIVIEKA